MKQLLVIILLTLGVLGVSARKQPKPSDADVRKSDYLFLEAVNARNSGRTAASLQLLDRAWQLNPDSTSAMGALHAFSVISATDGDSASWTRALPILDAYVRANPSDKYYGQIDAAYNRVLRNDSQRALDIYATLDSIYPTDYSISDIYARLLEDARRYDKAVDLYRRLETSLGPSTALTSRIINVQLNMQNDTAAALAQMDDFLRRVPANGEALELATSLYGRLGRYDQALTTVQHALSLDSTLVGAHTYLIGIYDKQHDAARRDSAFLRAMDVEDMPVEGKGYIMMAYNTATEANDSTPGHNLKVIGDYVDRHPGETFLRLGYAQLLGADSQYGPSAEQLEIYLNSTPETNEDRLSLTASAIQSYMRADRNEDALRVADRGMAEFPEDPSMPYLAGAILTVDGDYAAAYSVLKRALRNSGGRPEMLSEIYSSMGDAGQKFMPVDSVIADYDHALEFNPENFGAYNNYAYFLAEHGVNLEKAADMASKAVVAQPGSATYLDTAAWVAYKQGNYDKAAQYIESAIVAMNAEHNDNAEILAELMRHAGDIYQARGDTDKAMQYWKRGLDASPDDAELQSRIRNKGIK